MQVQAQQAGVAALMHPSGWNTYLSALAQAFESYTQTAGPAEEALQQGLRTQALDLRSDLVGLQQTLASPYLAQAQQAVEDSHQAWLDYAADLHQAEVDLTTQQNPLWQNFLLDRADLERDYAEDLASLHSGLQSSAALDAVTWTVGENQAALERQQANTDNTHDLGINLANRTKDSAEFEAQRALDRDADQRNALKGYQLEVAAVPLAQLQAHHPLLLGYAAESQVPQGKAWAQAVQEAARVLKQDLSEAQQAFLDRVADLLVLQQQSSTQVDLRTQVAAVAGASLWAGCNTGLLRVLLSAGRRDIASGRTKRCARFDTRKGVFWGPLGAREMQKNLEYPGFLCAFYFMKPLL